MSYSISQSASVSLQSTQVSGLGGDNDIKSFYATSLMNSDAALLGRFFEQGQSAGFDRGQQLEILRAVMNLAVSSNPDTAKQVFTNFQTSQQGSLGLEARALMQHVADALNELWVTSRLPTNLADNLIRTLGNQGANEILSLLGLHGQDKGPDSLLAHLVKFCQQQGLSFAATLGQQFLTSPQAELISPSLGRGAESPFGNNPVISTSLNGFSQGRQGLLAPPGSAKEHATKSEQVAMSLGNRVKDAVADVRTGTYPMSAHAEVVALAQLSNQDPTVSLMVTDVLETMSPGLLEQAYEAILPINNNPVNPAALTLLQARRDIRWDEPPRSRNPKGATRRCAADLKVLLAGLARGGGSSSLEELGDSLAQYFAGWVLDPATASETFDAIEAELIHFVQEQSGGFRADDVINTLCTSIVDGGGRISAMSVEGDGFFTCERVRERTAKLLSSVLGYACAKPLRSSTESSSLLRSPFRHLATFTHPKTQGLALGNTFARPLGGATQSESSSAHELSVYFYNAMINAKRSTRSEQEVFILFYDQFARILDVISTNSHPEFSSFPEQLPTHRGRILDLAQAVIRHREPSAT